MLPHATSLGNEHPDLLTSVVNMSLARACHAKDIFADSLQMSHAIHRFWTMQNCKTITKPACFTYFWGAESIAPAPQNDFAFEFNMDSRYFWHLNFQRRSLNMKCFDRFYFQMCFVPQHVRFLNISNLNFQKWCKNAGLLAYWLWHVRHSTMMCSF